MNMDKHRNTIVAVLVVLILGGLWLLLRPKEPTVAIFDSQAAVRQQEANDRSVPIEEYVKRNISGLSAEAGFPEVARGSFSITKIEVKGGKGTVSYEDGHNAYIADFTYTKDKKGLVSVTGFTVRK